jgi:hypothetical protein
MSFLDEKKWSHQQVAQHFNVKPTLINSLSSKRKRDLKFIERMEEREQRRS